MKKIILLILTIVVITSLFSCGKEELVERSIDGVAAYLGYHDGEDIDIYSEEKQMYGALAGKYFKDGDVSIYEFSPDSPSYEYWSSQTDTCIDGFVLLYGDKVSDTKIMEEIDKIKSIKFKEETDEE